MLICQFASVQNTFWNRLAIYLWITRGRRCHIWCKINCLFCSFHSPQSLSRNFDNTLLYRWQIYKPCTAFIRRTWNACRISLAVVFAFKEPLSRNIFVWFCASESVVQCIHLFPADEWQQSLTKAEIYREPIVFKTFINHASTDFICRV